MSMINNALSGSLAAQAALTVASQNVANVMTPGYTRQGVLLTSAQPSRTGPFAAGDGVNIPKLFRFSDDYKTLQMWNAASNQGQHATIERHAFEPRDAARGDGDKQADEPFREDDADRAGNNGQHRGLQQQMADQLAATRAERRPHRELAPTRRRARHEQIGDIGAGDRQHEGDRAEQ